MQIKENGKRVLTERYLLKDENGNIVETIEGLFRRVAHATAEAEKIFDPEADTEKLAQDFYEMMTNLDFLPNSPTLMNAGTTVGQLSACFVLPVEDSMEGIFESVKNMALIHKSGGGTGFSFTKIRPAGAIVSTTGGAASGPISFMKVFNAGTDTVIQGSRRRGANMAVLNVDHPDIRDFIDCKKDNNELNNFNISVGVTEKFMDAAEKGEDYELIDPHNGKITGTLNASEVFNKIVDAAWRNGEPGILFIDRMDRDNIVPGEGKLYSTNPCGEQPLLPYESCNLGSINLSNMVVSDENGKTYFDYEHLRKTVRLAVRFLDNIIEINRYPLDIIDKTTKKTRKIGLGIMGWADALLKLEIPYNSEDACELADKFMCMIRDEGRRESEELARERGAFPLFAESTYAKNGAAPLRNGTITTIAPTGSISIIAGCSSGVEPIFAYAYIRKVMDGTELPEVNPILEEVLRKRGLYSDELMRKIAQQGSLAHIPEIPEDIRNIFVSAHDISPKDHIRMQAAFQKYTDNAVSKTVNFPHDATREEVAEVYRLAYRLGCKGTTIYRDGSRDEQVLNIGSTEPKKEPEKPMKRERPKTVTGITERMRIGCGNLYVTVNCDENGLCEVLTTTGKAGGCPSQSDATAMLISLGLRSGIEPETIINELRGIRCPSTISKQDMDCLSCPDAIARVMKKEFEKEQMLNEEAMMFYDMEYTGDEGQEPSENGFSECPECHQMTLTYQDGCSICLNCSYSKCG